MTSNDTPTIVSFGEALWDCVPDGLFLGGAPFNVAYHAARLGAKAYPATCVGRDFLGDQVVARAKSADLGTELINRHESLETGVAIATLDESGNASYDIRMPAAWDEIELSTEQLRVVAEADAFVYGSLASRSETTRSTLERAIDRAEGLKVCDVNFREPYDDLDRAIRLARQADVVKLNDSELYRISGLDSANHSIEEALEKGQEKLGVAFLCVTLGQEGAIARKGHETFRSDPKKVEVADTIGAGDSFTAALIVALIGGKTPEQALARGAALGAFVASQRGAQPNYQPSEVFG